MASHVLFFGDHATDKLALIRTLNKLSEHSPGVKRYIEEATDTLQLEFAQLALLGHKKTTFDSLLQLAEQNALDEEKGFQDGVLTCVLTCVGRLGMLVAHAENDVSILGTTSTSTPPVEVIGLCMGLLPSAAAIAARDTSQIFTLGREILRLAFRMAHSIWSRMRLVDDSPGSWATVILGGSPSQVQDILDRFHEECKIPVVRRIALGVKSKSFVTLFGAPTTFDKLYSWPGGEVLRDAHKGNAMAGGCVHSPYMPKLDVQAILDDFSSEFLEWPLDFKSKSRMASPFHCNYYDHDTLGGLVEEILNDIAHNVLDLDGTLHGCVSRLQLESDASNIKVALMGDNIHITAMSTSLKSAGITHAVILDALGTPKAPFTSTGPMKGSHSSVQSNRGQSGLIAIVGMAGRFPDNDTVSGFWSDVLDGKIHISEVPSDRFNVKDWHDPSLEAKNSTVATKGAWLANPGLFDHRLFNISPREAAQMDPIHRYLLTCSYEALQHAGYNPGASLSMCGDNISTFFGQLGEDWHDIIHQQGADIYYVPGIARTFAPSRVNYHYKFGGGSYAVDSACASSITTVVLACQALLSRACDLALAGGGSMMYTPVPFSGLSKSGMISPTDGCRTFHDDADGYARGEGIGVVVLKRLEDAIADNDNILGVIRGSARQFSTTTNSITHPSHESQERVYKRVLAQANLDPSEVAYVEMHGTGTQAGDFEEITSIINVMARPGLRTSDNPLTVGTVKAGVGHGEAAAGVTALIKVLLMMREKVIPSQPGYPFKINTKFPPLDPLNLRIATKAYTLKPSPKGDKRIKVMVNSFDASGGESCLAIEEPPVTGETRETDRRTAHVVTISGRTPVSLRENRQRLFEWLDLNPDAHLADIAYTTTARRMHEPLKAAYVVKSTDDLAQQLSSAVMKNDDPKIKPKPAGRIFLFTGQGSQYAGMGSLLFHTNPTFRTKLLVYQDLATHMGLPRFVDAIIDAEFDVASASATQVQLAIVALEICIAETLASYGVTPTAVIGHSLGEYAALCIAGVLSVTDALALVGRRALLIEQHLQPNTFAMLATSATPEELQEAFASLNLASGNVACKNAPTMTVASGTVADIETLQAHMKSTGARSTLLRIPYGFHSAQVDPILDEFSKLASGVVFKAPVVPVVSSFLGRVISTGEDSVFGPDYLVKQCRGTVDYVGAVRAAAAAEKAGLGKALWLEMGPDPILLGLTLKTLPELSSSKLLPTFKASPMDDNWNTVSKVLAATYESGVDVNWPVFHGEFKECLRLLELPLYAFDYRNFWHAPFEDPEKLLEKRAKELELGSNGDLVGRSALAAPSTCAKCAGQASRDVPVPSKVSSVSSFPGFPTTSVPVVESEAIDPVSSELVAEFTTDTSHPDVLRIIEGHVVHGHAICPMSFLVDIALTTAKHCHFRLHGKSSLDSPGMSISHINMTNALVLQADEPRKPVIRTRAVMRKGETSANITFSWVKYGKSSTPETSVGGVCTVNFEQDQGWPASFMKALFLIKMRIQSLRSEALQGQAHRLLKPVVYRMFAESVAYSEPFQGLDEAIVDMDSRDAVARITLPDTSISHGSFVMNPFWTDALTHLGGFFVNSGLRYDNRETLCMARGFDSWRVVGDGATLKQGKTYTNYTFMEDVPGGFVIGDCYIFDENDNLVQTLMGLKFQKLKTAVLGHLLGGSGSATQHTLPAPIATPIFERRQSTFMNKALSSPPRRPSLIPAEPISPPTSVSGNGDDTSASEVLQTILSIVAKECGCPEEQMVDEAAFADLGIDSLMGISILSVVKRNTGIDLDATFFIQQQTVGEARLALEAILGVVNTTPKNAKIQNQTHSAVKETKRLDSNAQRELVHPAQTMREIGSHFQNPVLPTPPPEEMLKASSFDFEKPVTQTIAKPPSPSPEPVTEQRRLAATPAAAEDAPKAKIVHLSGPKINSEINMYLLADETGSSMSYIQLPMLTSSQGKPISVWGVDSPFVNSPALFSQHSIQGVAALMLQSIQSHHPTSSSKPMLLGGVGAAAPIAVEVARLFQSSTASPARVVLIDPSFSAAEVQEASSAPGVRLKPAHREHSRCLGEALERYGSSAGPVVGSSGVALVHKALIEKDQHAIDRLIPGISIRTMESAAAKGVSMRFPAVNGTCEAFQQAVNEVAK